ncbi:helix-turn-helix transcriptional regulator [Micrococcoides hystricis]|uniref:Helix-turn-helix transcriptional regulator n=1 Tax=Micrococcoides hystricis TaxID=1572761 RepID=A0ABV6P788_9MICC
MAKIPTTERLISLVVLLVETRKGLTKAQIFEKIETYRDANSPDAREKMFDRDKAVLRSVGIPLQLQENEAFGGGVESRYVIDQASFTLEELSFTQEEAAALAAVRDFWGGGDFSDAAKRALGRLDTAASQQVLTDQVAGTTFQFTDALTDEASFAEITEAISQRRSISFNYRAADGSAAERTIAPWALIQRSGAWYVTGHDHDRGERRNFKLTRILRNADHETSVREVDREYVGTEIPLAELAAGVAPVQRYPDITLFTPAAEQDHVLGRLFGEDVEPQGGKIVIHNPDEAVLWNLLTDHDLQIRFAPADHPVLDAFTERLQRLLTAQEDAVAKYTPHVDELTPLKAQRQRLSAADEMRLIFDIIAYTVANDGATHAELQQRFGLTPKALRTRLEKLPLYGLPQGGPDELFELNDDGQAISVSQVDAVAKPLSLAPVEAISTLLGLQSLAKLRRDIAPAAMGAYEKIRQALAARSLDRLAEFIWWDHSGVSAAASQLEAINQAIDTGRKIRLNYRTDTAGREVTPVQVRQFLADVYLLGWCHRADAPRVFKLSRCHRLELSDHGTLTDHQHQAVVEQDIFAAPAGSEQLTLFADYQIADHMPAMNPTHELALGEGDQLLRVPRVSDDFLTQSVLANAPKMLIIEPADLVAKVKQQINDRLELITDERA